MAAFDILGQQIVASTLIVIKDNDPFFNPTTSLNFTGFAADGFYYDDGIRSTNPQATWFLEAQSAQRGPLQSFPTAALVLLSPVSLSIFDATNSSGLVLWMQFLLNDGFILTDNFSGTLVGFTPAGLTYAAGVITVTYTPDAGSLIQSTLAVSVDFTQDEIYLHVAVTP